MLKTNQVIKDILGYENQLIHNTLNFSKNFKYNILKDIKSIQEYKPSRNIDNLNIDIIHLEYQDYTRELKGINKMEIINKYKISIAKIEMLILEYVFNVCYDYYLLKY